MVAATLPAVESIVGAVVFTDIVGFTEYTAVQGDERAIELLAVQEQIVRDALPGGARIVKELGDGLLLWFPDACDAVRTTIALQRQFEARTNETMLPLWVRIGIHWGRQAVRRDYIVGHDVNVAARIMDIAGPGEVVLSAATVEAVAQSLPGVAFEELGPVVMKGIPDAVQLFRVADAGAWGGE